MAPAGARVVEGGRALASGLVLEGSGEFIREIDGRERRFPIEPARSAVNPTGVWHSADVTEPNKAIHLTPCPGAQHRKRDASLSQ